VFRNDGQILRNVIALLPLPLRTTCNSYSSLSRTTDSGVGIGDVNRVRKETQSAVVGLLHSSKDVALEIIPFLKSFYTTSLQTPTYVPTTRTTTAATATRNAYHSSQMGVSTSSSSSTASGVWSPFISRVSIIDVPHVRQCIQSILSSSSSGHSNHHHGSASTAASTASFHRGHRSQIPEESATNVDLVAEIGEDIDDSFDDDS